MPRDSQTEVFSLNTANHTADDKAFFSRVVEATIRIGLIALLVAWCFHIVRPFIVPLIWGLIIAVAMYPGYQRLERVLGGRSRLAATLIAVLMGIVLIIPSVMLAETLASGAQTLADGLQSGKLKIPPPSEQVGQWPVVGEPLQAFWHKASTNLEAAIESLEPQLKALGAWLLHAAADAGLGVLQFVVAIVIAGIMLAHAHAGSVFTQALGCRLAGQQGADFVEVAGATVRSVARGILGVALIQSLLAGIGFLAVGVPGAGLWAVVALLLSVIQVGIFPVVLPVLVYVFYTADTGVAVVFLIWSLFVGSLDNILKPILLGRGVKVPMVIIFVGAIGGFVSSGIIGLFTGAVILALGYKLFLAWLQLGSDPETG